MRRPLRQSYDLPSDAHMINITITESLQGSENLLIYPAISHAIFEVLLDVFGRYSLRDPKFHRKTPRIHMRNLPYENIAIRASCANRLDCVMREAKIAQNALQGRGKKRSKCSTGWRQKSFKLLYRWRQKSLKMLYRADRWT
ncbi:hypothetical protein AVEN_80926-1 [Araneus ventricosus]|uniref:Uncharacterized protein n=1 Tax=Araneus ventricosus TaxID=182803 RepID=A0A4Y2GQ44_ARAVE|nr:hypothetical protein AVEN_80926-1 [Araneus ventricosus]